MRTFCKNLVPATGFRPLRRAGLSLFLLGVMACASEETQIDPAELPLTVARVNETEIDRTALVSRASSIQKLADAHGNEGTKRFYLGVLDELIVSELLFQQAEELGLVPGLEEIAERVETIRQRFGSEAEFQQTLASQGLTREQMAEALRKDLAVKNLIEDQLLPLVEIEEDQVRDYFSKNPDSFRRPEQRRASHILIATGSNTSAADKEQARIQLLELRRQIEQGKEFAELAETYSEDSETAARGGDLSWISRGQTLPEFEEVLFSLSDGEVSEPVETGWGFHLIKLTDQRAEKKLTFEEARGSAYQFLREIQLQRLTAELAAQLRQEARVEVFL